MGLRLQFHSRLPDQLSLFLLARSVRLPALRLLFESALGVITAAQAERLSAAAKARAMAATKCDRDSGIARPRGAKACRSRKKPVMANALAKSVADAGVTSSRRKAGSARSLSRYSSPPAR